MKYFLDNFVYLPVCSTVWYILAVELDALPSYLKAGTAYGSLCISTPPASLLKTPIGLPLLSWLQFAEVLIAQATSGDE